MCTINRMDQSEILGLVAIIISVGGTILGVVNHKKIRSRCCSREMVVSVDIEPTTPPSDKHRNQDLKIDIEKKSIPQV